MRKKRAILKPKVANDFWFIKVKGIRALVMKGRASGVGIVSEILPPAQMKFVCFSLREYE